MKIVFISLIIIGLLGLWLDHEFEYYRYKWSIDKNEKISFYGFPLEDYKQSICMFCKPMTPTELQKYCLWEAQIVAPTFKDRVFLWVRYKIMYLKELEL